MRRDVLELRDFYGSALGQTAHEMLSRKIHEAWGDPSGLDILGVGYATPYLETMRSSARRTIAAMPAAQGVEVWPDAKGNLSLLMEEHAVPLTNALFDRVLAVHALEESADPQSLLAELSRVMAPSGRLIVAVAARHGLWAQSEKTPFGFGRPYSRSQLAELIRSAGLEPTGWTRALYVPPLAWMSSWREGFEQLGALLWPPLSGIVLMEAVKYTFAVKSEPRPQRVRVFAPAGGMVPSRRDRLP